MPSSKAQYHHFVPRFMLRNFQDDSGQVNPSGTGNKQRRKGRNRGRGRSDGEISFLNLKTMNIESQSVSRVFGLSDMYKADLGNEPDPFHLEKKLSKLESEAARLLKKAIDTFAVDGALLELSRQERNQLRRFFFLMKYRGSGQYKRFNHASIKTYDADDKDRMTAYMKAKGFARPKDVWQANLDTFMTIEMDAAGKWMPKLLNMVFEDDAAMFIGHVQLQYMSFCRSRSYEKEFFITENAYSIFEGLQNGSNEVQGLYTEFHNFAPIDPHLIVIFRSLLLSDGLENEQQEQARLVELTRHLAIHNVEKYESELASLPIRKPRTEYSQAGRNDEVRESASNRAPIEFCRDDKFFFECFTIFHAHVELINDILLEQSCTQSLVAFRNRKDFAGAVRAYLLRRRKGYKIVTSDTGDKYKPFLDAMGVFASRELGIKVQPVYKVLSWPEPRADASHYATLHVVGGVVSGKRPDLLQIHKNLAGEAHDRMVIFEDAEQVNIMMFLRIKIDVIMAANGLEDAQKEKVRGWCRMMFFGVRARRVWLYLKVARNMDNLSPSDFSVLRAPLNLDGPEDPLLKELENVGLSEYEVSARMLLLDKLARGGH